MRWFLLVQFRTSTVQIGQEAHKNSSLLCLLRCASSSRHWKTPAILPKRLQPSNCKIGLSLCLRRSVEAQQCWNGPSCHSRCILRRRRSQLVQQAPEQDPIPPCSHTVTRERNTLACSSCSARSSALKALRPPFSSWRKAQNKKASVISSSVDLRELWHSCSCLQNCGCAGDVDQVAGTLLA